MSPEAKVYRALRRAGRTRQAAAEMVRRSHEAERLAHDRVMTPEPQASTPAPPLSLPLPLSQDEPQMPLAAFKRCRGRPRLPAALVVEPKRSRGRPRKPLMQPPRQRGRPVEPWSRMSAAACVYRALVRHGLRSTAARHAVEALTGVCLRSAKHYQSTAVEPANEASDDRLACWAIAHYWASFGRHSFRMVTDRAVSGNGVHSSRSQLSAKAQAVVEQLVPRLIEQERRRRVSTD